MTISQGDIKFSIINSKHVTLCDYMEEDKMLRVCLGSGDSTACWGFEIKTKEEAIKTITKILDENDSSLIELELHLIKI